MKLFMFLLFAFNTMAFEVAGEGENKEQAVKNALFNLSIQESFQFKGIGGTKGGILSADTVLINSDYLITEISKVSCKREDLMSCLVKGRFQRRNQRQRLILPVLENVACEKLKSADEPLVECYQLEDVKKFEQAGYLFWKANLVFLNYFRTPKGLIMKGSKTLALSAVGRNHKELALIIQETVSRAKRSWLKDPERVAYLNQQAQEFILFDALTAQN